MGIHKQNNSKKKKSIFLTSLQQFNDGFLNWFSEVCLSVYTGRYDNYIKPFEIDGSPLKYVVYEKVIGQGTTDFLIWIFKIQAFTLSKIWMIIFILS